MFWVDRLVLVALGRSSWWEHCACDRRIFLRSHRRGTLCYDMHPSARRLPPSPPDDVHDLSPRLGSSIVPKQRWIASGMLAQWEHAIHATWINSSASNWFDSICSRSLWGLIFQFDRIDLPSISLAPIYKCLLGDSFFDGSYETSSRFIKSVDLNRFDLKKFLR